MRIKFRCKFDNGRLKSGILFIFRLPRLRPEAGGGGELKKRASPRESGWGGMSQVPYRQRRTIVFVWQFATTNSFAVGHLGVFIGRGQGAHLCRCRRSFRNLPHMLLGSDSASGRKVPPEAWREPQGPYKWPNILAALRRRPRPLQHLSHSSRDKFPTRPGLEIAICSLHSCGRTRNNREENISARSSHKGS